MVIKSCIYQRAMNSKSVRIENKLEIQRMRKRNKKHNKMEEEEEEAKRNERRHERAKQKCFCKMIP